MPTLDRLFNRFDEAQNFDSHLFLAGRNLQSAELNEIQSQMHARISAVSNALFKNGDLIRDAAISVDPDTGVTKCQSGAVYVAGAVRGVPPGAFTIPVNETVLVGLYLVTSVISELEDKSLKDPAIGSRNYGQGGALRRKIEPSWGYAGDGMPGEFYPIYTVENGYVRSKEPPPNLDAVTQALARYDRDSSGGSYVVSGLSVAKQADVAGDQVYTVTEGRARVGGLGVELVTSRRVIYPASADLRPIDAEPHISTGPAAQRVAFDRTPVANIAAVRITQQKTATLTHGGFTGAQDSLPENSIVAIVAINQGGVLNGAGTGFTGGTTYIQGTDYKLTAGKVDWSLPGGEVTPGSTYQAIYQCIATVVPTAVDDSGFTVAGAVTGTQILVSYSQKLPRIDMLCLNGEGSMVWLKGVSAAENPQRPAVPVSMLALATVYQTWTSARAISNDGVRVVPMQDIANINTRIDQLTSLMAQLNLKTDANNRDASLKKGVFVDPFLNDSVRDQGVAQTASIVRGQLTLSVTATPAKMGADIAAAAVLPYTLEPVLSQTIRSGSMLVNPYMAFTPIPATVQITPAIDRWQDEVTVFGSPVTDRITKGNGDNVYGIITTTNNVTFTNVVAARELRQIEVAFKIAGFLPNEQLVNVFFDGVSVTPVAQ